MDASTKKSGQCPDMIHALNDMLRRFHEANAEVVR